MWNIWGFNFHDWKYFVRKVYLQAHKDVTRMSSRMFSKNMYSSQERLLNLKLNNISPTKSSVRQKYFIQRWCNTILLIKSYTIFSSSKLGGCLTISVAKDWNSEDEDIAETIKDWNTRTRPFEPVIRKLGWYHLR